MRVRSVVGAAADAVCAEGGREQSTFRHGEALRLYVFLYSILCTILHAVPNTGRICSAESVSADVMFTLSGRTGAGRRPAVIPQIFPRLSPRNLSKSISKPVPKTVYADPDVFSGDHRFDYFDKVNGKRECIIS